MTGDRRLRETASQTAGPYVHIGLAPRAAGFAGFEAEFGNVLAGPSTQGERIVIEGLVLDGEGAPVRDALLEIWQANADGRYDDPSFRGWGRAATDFETGLYRFETVKPDRVGGAAPHASLWLVARGINIGLATRIYFPDEANGDDPVLALVPAERRATLVAGRSEAGRYRFDIRLQGDRETVFFDV